MARPLKRGLDYFPLNVDFFDSEEIFCLGAELGSKAEFVALRLLASIYRNGYYLEWNTVARATIARKMELGGEFIDRVVSKLVDLGFFDRRMFNDSSVLTSVRIQEIYFEAIKRRSRRPAEFPYLLLMLTKTQVNVDNNPQRKGNENEMKGNDTLSSNDDDNDYGDKSPLPSSPPVEKKLSMDDELEMMLDLAEADSHWVAEMAAYLKHPGGGAAVSDLLRGDFRSHCIREAKTHRNLSDLKAHFNRWAIKHTNKNNSVNSNNSDYYGKNSSRRCASPYELKLPVNPACGLKRRPDSTL